MVGGEVSVGSEDPYQPVSAKSALETRVLWPSQWLTRSSRWHADCVVPVSGTARNIP